MLEVSVDRDRIRFGQRLAVSFHRTLRVPEDGRTWPLPAGLGLFPILPLRRGGRVAHAVPMYRREAMWIGFAGAHWKPNAVKVVVGGINAVTGLPEADGMERRPGAQQDYLVCPLQPWLDGFNAGGGRIRQFVAMPLGEGYGVEAGHGLEERGGLAITVFEPRPGRFPDAPPAAPPGPVRLSTPRPSAGGGEMALGAGGEIRQKLYPDPHGREAWDPEDRGRAEILLLDSRRFAELAGTPPPPTPVDAAAYAAAGLPWFDLYDESAAALAPAGGPPRWTVRDRDRERGEAAAEERPPGVDPDRVVTLRRRGPAPARRAVREGTNGPEGDGV